MARRRPEDLRSHRWYGATDMRSFGHRSRTAQMGYDAADYMGKPVIGILNTWSDILPCHMHFKKPTTMLYRNMLAMQAEEMLRSYPIDGAVLMGGCDKTTPGLIMGATSMRIPFIYMTAGAMLKGNASGRTIG